MLDLTKGDAKIFLAAYGVAAIYVASLDRTAFAIASARDVSRSLASLRTTWPDASVTAIFWCDGHSKARRVVALARGVSRDARTSAVIEAVVARAAADAGVRLTGHEVMTRRLQRAIVQFDRRLSDAKAAGHLKFFHQAYRERRLAHADARRRFPTFAEAQSRMRRYLIARHARESGGALQINEGDLLRFVFDGRHSHAGDPGKRKNPDAISNLPSERPF